jgi:xanthine dehydrogenase accessory factor
VIKSAPRQPGAAMAVSDQGEVVGSVSGGCVEAALYEEAQAVLTDGRPRLCRYGISDEEAFSVGLTCGGTIEVFVQRIDGTAGWVPALADALQAERPVTLVTEIATGATNLMDVVATSGLQEGSFRQAFVPPPRMLVFGAIDFAVATVRMGKFLGYRVTLCDARPVFATRARFPEADEVVVRWPHEYLAEVTLSPRDAICVLTHDAKFDVPALVAALKTEAGFIGALGSRRTWERRRQELLAEGVSARDLVRISSPVGLDIGGQTPEETAVSIAAEIIALRNGRSGGRLAESTERIHVSV